MSLTRRSLLTLFAAPAIVRISSIMPVKAIRAPTEEEVISLLKQRMSDTYHAIQENMVRSLFYTSSDAVPPRYNGGTLFSDDFEYKELYIPISVPPK